MNVNHGITDTGKLKTIEIDKYEPIPDKPGRCRAVGQASKQEIFDQLKDHLEYVGMLPDEYFMISTQQPEIIPENWRDFTCNVSYGDISRYLPQYRKWLSELHHRKNPQRRCREFPEYVPCRCRVQPHAQRKRKR